MAEEPRQISAEGAWDQCLDIIRDNVSDQSFTTWFAPLTAVSLENDGKTRKLTVKLPSRFYYEWLEEHYFSLLCKTVTNVLGDDGRLYYDIVINQQEADDVMQLPARPGPSHKPVVKVERQPFKDRPTRFKVNSNLNPAYTFDNFIEGDCNRLARSAGLAISRSPGETPFNPLLVYGGVGLGKTHLIHAIGNRVRGSSDSKNIVYASSERFTNQFVASIQNNKVRDFSAFYRSIDLLIIDDVQFFGGKEKTQEEFFHIFNDLHTLGKQIILSADRSPRDIQGIEERLLSRFKWGLTADLQPPELETRIAILNRKASGDGLEFSPEVIHFIAQHITNNIRELEGALIRLLAHTTLHEEEISASVAKVILRDLIQPTYSSLTIDQIQAVVCRYFNIDQDLVRAKTRKREVVQARQVGMYFSKQLTQHSLKTIGLHFGGRDHSTVIHANRSINNQLETDANFRSMLESLQQQFDLHSR